MKKTDKKLLFALKKALNLRSKTNMRLEDKGCMYCVIYSGVCLEPCSCRGSWIIWMRWDALMDNFVKACERQAKDYGLWEKQDCFSVLRKKVFYRWKFFFVCRIMYPTTFTVCEVKPSLSFCHLWISAWHFQFSIITWGNKFWFIEFQPSDNVPWFH